MQPHRDVRAGVLDDMAMDVGEAVQGGRGHVSGVLLAGVRLELHAADGADDAFVEAGELVSALSCPVLVGRQNRRAPGDLRRHQPRPHQPLHVAQKLRGASVTGDPEGELGGVRGRSDLATVGIVLPQVVAGEPGLQHGPRGRSRGTCRPPAEGTRAGR